MGEEMNSSNKYEIDYEDLAIPEVHTGKAQPSGEEPEDPDISYDTAIPEFHFKKKHKDDDDNFGTVYGVGVGPGDPELLTVKAIRVIKEADVIAAPGRDPGDSIAYRIALRAVPEIKNKPVIHIDMPLKKDQKAMDDIHLKGALSIEKYLKQGRSVAYLTLGDSTVYSTFLYLVPFLENDGFKVRYVSGISSYCAAAARLGVPLCREDQKLHIVPAAHDHETDFNAPGNFVLMKSGRMIKDLRVKLKDCSKEILAVENCGLPGERVYSGISDIPDDAGSLLVIMARDGSVKG